MPSVTIHVGPDQKLDGGQFADLSEVLATLIVDRLGAAADKVQVMPVALAQAPLGRPVYIEIKARKTTARTEQVLKDFVGQVDEITFQAFGCRCRIRYFAYPGEFLAASN